MCCKKDHHTSLSSGLMLVVLFFLAGWVNAQDLATQEKDSCYAGAYITQDDFVHNRLSYKIKESEEGYKLDFTFPADMTLTLKIVTPDTTYKFRPGSIYGYHDCGKVFRFFPGGKELNAQEDFYKIEEAGEGLIIYSSEFVSGNEIFYSVDLTSPIHRLTMKNLEDDFSNYPEFMEEAKKLKKSTDGLVTRDEDGFAIMRIYQYSAVARDNTRPDR
jgi:hypothetical protein